MKPFLPEKVLSSFFSYRDISFLPFFDILLPLRDLHVEDIAMPPPLLHEHIE
jgi:hypothetical protein